MIGNVAADAPAELLREAAKRVEIMTRALEFFSSHELGSMAAWRYQQAAFRAYNGREDWDEPLTRPTSATLKRRAEAVDEQS